MTQTRKQMRTPLTEVLNARSQPLRIAGLILFPVGAFAGWLGTRPRVHRSLVIVVIVLNALWAVDSVFMLLTRWVETTPIGEFFVIGLAVIVATIAELELIGLRRSTLVESYARH
jgi:CHASE2 domain-containing sensor protein